MITNPIPTLRYPIPSPCTLFPDIPLSSSLNLTCRERDVGGEGYIFALTDFRVKVTKALYLKKGINF